MRNRRLFLLAALVLLISCHSSNREQNIQEDQYYKKLQEAYDTDRLKEILQSARESIFKVWKDGKEPPLPPSDLNPEGVAVRLIVDGKDRGCIAWYMCVGDMNLFAAWCAAQALNDPRYEPLRPEEAENTLVELLIIGQWQYMSTPEDFIPGYHNLWLNNGHDIIHWESDDTILQASLAVQRYHTKKEFLEKICTKAGLDKDAWKKNKNLIWQRSPAVWIVEPLVDYNK